MKRFHGSLFPKPFQEPTVNRLKRGCRNRSGKAIKEFLETNYPQGRATGVFSWFHIDPMVKNRNSFIWDPETSSG